MNPERMKIRASAPGKGWKYLFCVYLLFGCSGFAALLDLNRRIIPAELYLRAHHQESVLGDLAGTQYHCREEFRDFAVEINGDSLQILPLDPIRQKEKEMKRDRNESLSPDGACRLEIIPDPNEAAYSRMQIVKLKPEREIIDSFSSPGKPEDQIFVWSPDGNAIYYLSGMLGRDHCEFSIYHLGERKKRPYMILSALPEARIADGRFAAYNKRTGLISLSSYNGAYEEIAQLDPELCCFEYRITPDKKFLLLRCGSKRLLWGGPPLFILKRLSDGKEYIRKIE